MLFQSYWQVIPLSGCIMTLTLTDKKERYLTCIMFQHGSHSFKSLAKDYICPVSLGYRTPVACSIGTSANHSTNGTGLLH